MQSYSIGFSNGGFLAIGQSTSFNFGQNDFTLEAWVKTLNGGTVFGRKGTDGGPGNGGYLLVVNPDGTIKFATDSGFGFYQVVSAASVVTDGVWHHVAAVRQGATLLLYLNGEQLQVMASGNAQPPLNVDNDRRLTIGFVEQEQEPNRPFHGHIGEARIWSEARSATNISAWAYEKLPQDAANLVGYWPTDFGLLQDFSPQRQTTNISGPVWTTTDAPPVLAKSEIPSLFLFAGTYDTGIKWGGASGTWQDNGPLYVTTGGIVVLGNTRIVDAEFSGNKLSWPANGNPNTANVTFRLSSDSTYYWPNGAETIPLFEGALQPPGSGAEDFRGLIKPQRTLCGVVLNAGNGQVMQAGAGQPGTVLSLGEKMPEMHEHFCVYDDDRIEFMKTRASVGLGGPAQVGIPLVLKEPQSNDTDTSWTFEADGTIRPKTAATLAIAVVNGGLELANADSNDPTQKWLSLSLTQFLWNGQPNQVLAAVNSGSGTYDQVLGQAKADDNDAQLWYFVRDAVLADVNAHALTVTGTPVSGARLGLAPYQGEDSQRFSANGSQLIHVPSGLVVKLDANRNVILADPTDTSAEATWIVAPREDISTVSRSAVAALNSTGSLKAVADSTVDYVVYITTASTVFAGTDDRVEIALVGQDQTTQLVQLSRSETHLDPFERGQTDRFTVRLKNVGRLRGLYFRYGENTWFGGERWVVSSVSVFDPSTVTWYSNASVGNGAQYEMPYKTTIYFNFSHVAGDSSTIAIGKAPTQDDITRGWVDHTWVVVKDSERTTYFDCGGGHEGPGTVNNIVTSKCNLNTAVRMATAYPIGPDHPYQPTYGTNDVEGKQTSGIRASGFRNWDGQCHQMTNRLLFIASPRLSLADAADQRPAGYGLTCVLWGPYGIGFSDWCRRIGVTPPDPAGDAIFDYVQRYLGNTRQSHKVMYHAFNMQDALKDDPENPQGNDVKAFFRNIHGEGIANSTISELVCLPEDKVEAEEL